jgi:putative regulator of septum formation
MVKRTLLVCFALIASACASAGEPALHDHLTRFADVTIGECFSFDAPESTTVNGVEVTDCGTPHTYELFFLGDTAATEWADVDTFRSEAVAACAPELEIYTGTPISERLYDFAYFTPSVREWEDGVRTFGCYAFALDGSQISDTVLSASDRRRVARRDLAAGTCFLNPISDLVFTVEVSDCSAADREMVGSVEHPSVSETYPVRMPDDAQSLCDAMFAEKSITGSATYFAPSPTGWASGDRTVQCLQVLTS